MASNSETWEPIADHPGYFISSHGRVKSLKRRREVIIAHGTSTGGYLFVNLYTNGKPHAVKIHRLVALHFAPNPRQVDYVDHIDGDRQNNHAENLRWVTFGENLANRSATRGSTSKYKGVSWMSHINKWKASICVNREDHYLGVFTNENDAARAYNRAAMGFSGEYARLNVIPDEDPASA